MIINFTNESPIYIQLADWLEEQIIDGSIRPADKMLSQIDLGKLLNINPATAGKALTLLAERNILDKRRGIGMYVTEDAIDIIKERRLKYNLNDIAKEFIKEGSTLGLDIHDLIDILLNINERNPQ